MSSITFDISELPEPLKIQLIEFFTQLHSFNSQMLQLPTLRDNNTRLNVIAFNARCLSLDIVETLRQIEIYKLNITNNGNTNQ